MKNEAAYEGQLAGLSLSPDGRLLAAASGDGVVVFDVEKLLAGNSDPIIASSRNGSRQDGAVYTVFTPDQLHLFVANERSGSLSVFDLTHIGPQLREVGRIAVGGAPVGLTVSSDGKYLYSTSEVGLRNWPANCTTEGPSHPEGILLVLDAAKAAVDPSHAMLSGVAAGCNPVRVQLSVDDTAAYVTARGDNLVEIYDTEKLRSDAQHALKMKVPVGPSPVGVTITEKRAFVANSNRFKESANGFLSAFEVKNPTSPQLIIAAGRFPREVNVTPDGNTLLLTNYISRDLEIIDLRSLPDAVR